MAASNKMFIVCGTRAEFEYFIRKKAQQLSESGYPVSLSDFVYVDNVNKMRGMREIHGYFYGTFRRREDLHDIVMQIRVSNNISAGDVILPQPSKI